MVDAGRDVLVVDSDPELLAFYDMLLTDAGFTVRTAAGLAAADAELGRRRPDVVIADLRLADAEPFAIVDRLAADPTTRALPLLLCTAAVEDLTTSSGWRSRPATAALHKPFDIDLLLHCLDRLLAGESVGLVIAPLHESHS
jgi:DNA-binding response OmpR family regulator